MTLEHHEIETLERRLLSLPDEIYRARLAHAVAKERALAADREYRQRKSELYGQYAMTEKSHYRIEHLVAAEPAYCQAKLARVAAELEVYRAWIEAERLNDMRAVAQALIRNTALAESPEEISN